MHEFIGCSYSREYYIGETKWAKNLPYKLENTYVEKQTLIGSNEGI